MHVAYRVTQKGPGLVLSDVGLFLWAKLAIVGCFWASKKSTFSKHLSKINTFGNALSKIKGNAQQQKTKDLNCP